ncbi:unnamed protein product [Rodentolepis nana]|uniref:Uncharacterized protein n=1 Tax=Rodentolepis nana TaxID=102285 RepID=A0A0R3TDV2_RODNA|nr:unnamed protein product [Rodentolepis nana]
MKGLLLMLLLCAAFVVLISCSPAPKNRNYLRTQNNNMKPRLTTRNKRSTLIEQKSPRQLRRKLPKTSNKPSIGRRRSRRSKIMKVGTKGNKVIRTAKKITMQPSVVTTGKIISTTTVEPTTFLTTQDTLSPTNFTEKVAEKTTTPERPITKSKIEKSEVRKRSKNWKNRYNQQQTYKIEPVKYYSEIFDPVLFPIIPQQTNQINPFEYHLLNPLPEHDQQFQWYYEPWPDFQYNSWEDSNWLASFKGRDKKPDYCTSKNKKKKPKKGQLKTVAEAKKQPISFTNDTAPQTTTTEEMSKITIPPLFQETVNEIEMLIDEHRTQLRSESNREIRRLLAKRMKASLEDGANHIKNLLRTDPFAGN